MDDMNRWLRDRETLGMSKKGLGGRAFLSFQQMLGKKFGTLTVLEYARLLLRPDGTGAKDRKWLCECSCSTEVHKVTLEVRESFLLRGYVTSCGKCNRVAVHDWPEFLVRKIALAVECEGSAGVYAGGTQNGPKIAIGVRDYAVELVNYVCSAVKLGNVTPYQKGDGTRMVQWQVSGFDAQVLARKLRPFAICKGAQLDTTIAFPIGDRRTRVTPEVKNERIRLARLTNVLNKKGPGEPKPEWADAAAKWVEWVEKKSSVEQRGELLASVIEWEGFLGVHEKKSSTSSGVHHSVQIGVPQAIHRKALLEVCRALGGERGGFTGIHIDKKHPENAPTTRWEVAALGETQSLAAEVVPHLVYKKRLAELILEFPEWDCAPYPVPSDIWHKRHALAVESKLLNRDEDEEDEGEDGREKGLELSKTLTSMLQRLRNSEPK